jgi:hypothetical protein
MRQWNGAGAAEQAPGLDASGKTVGGLVREDGTAEAVVPLASLGCEGLDCWSGSVEAALCWAPLCVRVERAPGGVLPTQAKPSLTATGPTMAVRRT